MPSTRLVSEALVETRMRTVYIALQCGAGKRNRTSDLRITNALLYQLSYSGETLILKHASRVMHRGQSRLQKTIQ
jgi:hypothetical protein